MEPSQNDATPVSGQKTPLAAPLDDFLDDKATAIHEDGSRSGSYAAQLERIFPMWIKWVDDRGVAHRKDDDKRSLASWTKYRSHRKAAEGDSDSGITRAAVWTYFNGVREISTLTRPTPRSHSTQYPTGRRGRPAISGSRVSSSARRSSDSLTNAPTMPST